MRTLYDLPAPAKINLFLHIIGRRADGYHLLQSVFLLLDWCDTLHIEARPHHSAISREDIQATDTPLPSEDLTVRAARAFRRPRAAVKAPTSAWKNACPRKRAWVVALRMQPLLCWRSTACGVWV